MQRPNVICLAIDRLHVGYIGTYGNTWVNTPSFDRLTAESFVFDRAIIDSPQLDIAYRSVWSGVHAACQPPSNVAKSLPAVFAGHGWHTTLLTDEMSVANHPMAAGFAERLPVGASSQSKGNLAGKVADTIDQTDASHLFMAAEQWLGNVKEPFLLWMHTGTLGRVWDAPLEFREQFADADDPELEDRSNLPQQILAENFDPDELLAISHAYAGQISLIDQFVNSLLEKIDAQTGGHETVIILYSPRGICLGEHRCVGIFDDAPYAEVIHTPLMIMPTTNHGSGRSQHLIQPADLYTTILDCCGLRAEFDSKELAQASPTQFMLPGQGRSLLPLMRRELTSGFDRACCIASSRKAFVTPAWSFYTRREDSLSQEHSASAESDPEPLQADELFVKPDDWFEVNEVSNRCPEIVEKMQTALSDFTHACENSKPSLLSPLPIELIEGME
jgi:hypothetical protein